MVTKDDGFAGGDVVDTVIAPFAGADCVGRAAENFTAEPAPVGVVGDNDANPGGECNEECSHDSRTLTLAEMGLKINAAAAKDCATKKMQKNGC